MEMMVFILFRTGLSKGFNPAIQLCIIAACVLASSYATPTDNVNKPNNPDNGTTNENINNAVHELKYVETPEGNGYDLFSYDRNSLRDEKWRFNPAGHPVVSHRYAVKDKSNAPYFVVDKTIDDRGTHSRVYLLNENLEKLLQRRVIEPKALRLPATAAKEDDIPKHYITKHKPNKGNRPDAHRPPTTTSTPYVVPTVDQESIPESSNVNNNPVPIKPDPVPPTDINPVTTVHQPPPAPANLNNNRNPVIDPIIYQGIIGGLQSGFFPTYYPQIILKPTAEGIQQYGVWTFQGFGHQSPVQGQFQQNFYLQNGVNNNNNYNLLPGYGSYGNKPYVPSSSNLNPVWNPYETSTETSTQPTSQRPGYFSTSAQPVTDYYGPSETPSPSPTEVYPNPSPTEGYSSPSPTAEYPSPSPTAGYPNPSPTAGYQTVPNYFGTSPPTPSTSTGYPDRPNYFGTSPPPSPFTPTTYTERPNYFGTSTPNTPLPINSNYYRPSYVGPPNYPISNPAPSQSPTYQTSPASPSTNKYPQQLFYYPNIRPSYPTRPTTTTIYSTTTTQNSIYFPMTGDPTNDFDIRKFKSDVTPVKSELLPTSKTPSLFHFTDDVASETTTISPKATSKKPIIGLPEKDDEGEHEGSGGEDLDNRIDPKLIKSLTG